MLRRTATVLGGGLAEYHDWHFREPLLMNYEGWRILDNPDMTRYEAWIEDAGGIGRHIDPIIDDPRLTHQQRVCRLYRWSLKELQMYFRGGSQGQRFNLAYKVIRARFEKYRYVTDPAMCDMMVRESQKYLRETCYPLNMFLRRNPTSPNANASLQQPMFHPDNAQCYDHWTPPEVFWYDDAKVHRYPFHHPANHGHAENWDRWGNWDEGHAIWTTLVYRGTVAFVVAYCILHFLGLPWRDDDNDIYFEWVNKAMEKDSAAAIIAEERFQRGKNQTIMVPGIDYLYANGKSDNNFSDGMLTRSRV